MLARLGFPSGRTEGRRYPELPHPYRDEFQRDRDRVLHSRAFRRLENKTQVFPQGLSDHFRNRLTHTIEVAQIARTVAGALELNQDLTEALALVHDIGHPPFGHAGEEELDRLMREHGGHFEHNLHALRIVERFEHRYARFPGLNLTFEVREGIVKHSHDIEPGHDRELDEYHPDLRPPLEAQLIDLCDEIAYNTSDLDDAFSAGLLEAQQLRAESAQFELLYDTAEMQYPGASERVRLHETVRGLVDWLVSGLIRGTALAAQDLRDVDDVRHQAERVARYTPEAAATNAELKTVLRREVYQSGMVTAERRASVSKITGLFEHLMQHPEALPEGYVEDSPAGELHRAVCDYIAGMTDRYLERVWAETIGK